MCQQGYGVIAGHFRPQLLWLGYQRNGGAPVASSIEGDGLVFKRLEKRNLKDEVLAIASPTVQEQDGRSFTFGYVKQ
jgi:hypothetical protein